MTFEDAQHQLEAARDGTPAAMQAGLDAVGKTAVDRIEAAWPRRTGRSGEAWTWDGRSIRNDTWYTSLVHDGLADTLVPQTLAGLDDTFRATVEQQLERATGGW